MFQCIIQQRNGWIHAPNPEMRDVFPGKCCTRICKPYLKSPSLSCGSDIIWRCFRWKSIQRAFVILIENPSWHSTITAGFPTATTPCCIFVSRVANIFRYLTGVVAAWVMLLLCLPPGCFCCRCFFYTNCGVIQPHSFLSCRDGMTPYVAKAILL